jgi:hypothetical protein
MFKLNDLLKKKKQFKDCFVRCIDWDHNILYFKVNYYDDLACAYVGELHDGTYFSVNEGHGYWVMYESGMELSAKAV